MIHVVFTGEYSSHCIHGVYDMTQEEFDKLRQEFDAILAKEAAPVFTGRSPSIFEVDYAELAREYSKACQEWKAAYAAWEVRTGGVDANRAEFLKHLGLCECEDNEAFVKWLELDKGIKQIDFNTYG